MKAVAIKKGQNLEKAADFCEMGILRCDGCGEEFAISQHPAFIDRGSPMNKHIGWRGSFRRNTSATKHMPTGLNCLADSLALFWFFYLN